MVLQRSKLSVRRTVMMLTIRSRNRDNDARREGVDRTHVVAREEPRMRNRFMDGAVASRTRRFSFFSFFFFNSKRGTGSRKSNSFRIIFVDTHFCV